MLLETVTTTVPAQPEIDADLSEFGTLSNKSRAAFGEAACSVGDVDFGVNDPATSAIDTIANILHYLDNSGEQQHPEWARRVIESALDHFTVEAMR